MNRGPAERGPEASSSAWRVLLRQGRAVSLLVVAALCAGLLALALSARASLADEGSEDVFFQEPAAAREIEDFKAASGPIVPADAAVRPGAQPFTAAKEGARLQGAVWFEDDQLVVEAVVETEGRSFIPQRMKLWTPDGRSLDSFVQPRSQPQETRPADPSEPPVTFSFGFGFSPSSRRSSHQSSQPSQPSQPQQKYRELRSCKDCQQDYYEKPPRHSEPPPQEHHPPPESHSPRIVPRFGISINPTAPSSTPHPPAPSQHRFPSPPCPRRLKGWSLGTTAPGPGRSIPLVAFLDEPPGAFVRTAACQVLVVMAFPPDQEGARETISEVARAQGLRLVRSFALRTINTLVALMERSGPAPLAESIEGLQSHPQVYFAQPNNLYRTSTYNDPLGDLQYGPRLIDAVPAHRVATGREVSVAIIDTAIDAEQPDLHGKVVEQVDLIGPDPPGLAGIHGTLMSGVISATENNGVGVYGVAPHVSLLGLKACQPLPENPVEAACSSESIARALDEAIQRKVRLINMSLGGPPDRLIETLIKKAASEDILVVAAVGNDGPEAPPSYPAAYEPVLAVSAVDLGDERYEKANVGAYVDLSAPGVDVVSTLPGGRFNVFSGTSIAAAHVTASAALLLQVKPNLTPAELSEALESTAVDLGQRGRDPQFGSGRINACRALGRVAGKSVCP